MDGMAPVRDCGGMVHCYFAYGSNMNPARVRERGLTVEYEQGAMLRGYRLVFDKHSAAHAGEGHANIVWDPGATVEGVLYRLAGANDIERMDRFERAPVNYSRDFVEVMTGEGSQAAWTYFANPAVRRPGLRPSAGYLAHLLAGEAYLSPAYVTWLRGFADPAGPAV